MAITPEQARDARIDKDGETWRAVAGFEGRYEVSDQGRVRSLRFRNRATDRARTTPLVLGLSLNRKGYAYVSLGGRQAMVHHLVLEAFVGPRSVGLEAGHLNGHPADNRPANLRWVTSSENGLHKVLHGTAARGAGTGAYTHPERLPRGESHGMSKVTAQQVLEIRAASAGGESRPSLRARFGVGESTIRDILSRRTWAHVDTAVLS